MRPPRLLLCLFAFLFLPFLFTAFSLISPRSYSGPSSGGLFSFNGPSSLFPPSAIVSLTDDNSTFFLARPAAFGPPIPVDGLSGQLWIGNGFGDDSFGKVEVIPLTEGELGCSDVPGWDKDSRKYGLGVDGSLQSRNRGGYIQIGSSPVRNLQDTTNKKSQKKPDGDLPPSKHDGTDDYMHHPLPESGFAGTATKDSSVGKSNKDNVLAHANVKLLQETAEMTGKIVLLSRGGCGFLEKVKWAQRRGAMAVVVGDNVRGGGLVTMYARGDTSNVTIPSVFTSHTTAHLLASLIPPEKNSRSNNPNAGYKDQTRDFSQSTKTTGELLTPGLVNAGCHPFLAAFRMCKLSYSTVDSYGRTESASNKNQISTYNSETNKNGFIVSENGWRDPHAVFLDKSEHLMNPAAVTDANNGIVAENHVSGRQEGEQNGQKKSTGKYDLLRNEHEGLWVTLTPTSMSASPFFDTLLVLVVSPLVTLSIVYAMLLIRSRIRQRRWRAPKSIIDRLPVRTYHAISHSPVQSPPAEASSSTSPFISRDRRSPSPSYLSNVTSHPNHTEKPTDSLLWRRKYHNRQSDCAVCLEEYVDGQSQVMGLPCGHEFHAECM